MKIFGKIVGSLCLIVTALPMIYSDMGAWFNLFILGTGLLIFFMTACPDAFIGFVMFAVRLPFRIIGIAYPRGVLEGVIKAILVVVFILAVMPWIIDASPFILVF